MAFFHGFYKNFTLLALNYREKVTNTPGKLIDNFN